MFGSVGMQKIGSLTVPEFLHRLRLAQKRLDAAHMTRLLGLLDEQSWYRQKNYLEDWDHHCNYSSFPHFSKGYLARWRHVYEKIKQAISPQTFMNVIDTNNHRFMNILCKFDYALSKACRKQIVEYAVAKDSLAWVNLLLDRGFWCSAKARVNPPTWYDDGDERYFPGLPEVAAHYDAYTVYRSHHYPWAEPNRSDRVLPIVAKHSAIKIFTYIVEANTVGKPLVGSCLRRFVGHALTAKSIPCLQYMFTLLKSNPKLVLEIFNLPLLTAACQTQSPQILKMIPQPNRALDSLASRLDGASINFYWGVFFQQMVNQLAATEPSMRQQAIGFLSTFAKPGLTLEPTHRTRTCFELAHYVWLKKGNCHEALQIVDLMPASGKLQHKAWILQLLTKFLSDHCSWAPAKYLPRSAWSIFCQQGVTWGNKAVMLQNLYIIKANNDLRQEVAELRQKVASLSVQSTPGSGPLRFT